MNLGEIGDIFEQVRLLRDLAPERPEAGRILIQLPDARRSPLDVIQAALAAGRTELGLAECEVEVGHGQ